MAALRIAAALARIQWQLPESAADFSACARTAAAQVAQSL
jgi:hypothetical protein